MGKKRSNSKTLDAVELSALLRSGPGPSAANFSTDIELGLLKKLAMVTTKRGGGRYCV